MRQYESNYFAGSLSSKFMNERRKSAQTQHYSTITSTRPQTGHKMIPLVASTLYNKSLSIRPMSRNRYNANTEVLRKHQIELARVKYDPD